MAESFLTVEAQPSGEVDCRLITGDEVVDQCRGGRLRLDGLDYQLVRHFSRWLTTRAQGWDIDEVRAFGQLLHRCLLADVWEWVRLQLDRNADDTLHLLLSFPSGRENASVASIPWEYLHVPAHQGPYDFLAMVPGLVLSRYASGPAPVSPLATTEPITVLPVVSDPDPYRLGEVAGDTVLDALQGLDPATGVQALPTLRQPTEVQLRQAMREHRPRLLHFIGHGEFDAAVGRGRVALVHPNGGTDWVDEYRLAGAVGQPGLAPLGVVLHTCEGGQVDYTDRFAGLAPELISRGVQCVVAMQYPVAPETAESFSIDLYEQLGRGVRLDVAVQSGRRHLVEAVDSDPRLVGVPMAFLSHSEPFPRQGLEESRGAP